MSAVEEVLEGLITVFVSAGVVLGAICGGWLLIDSVSAWFKKHKKNVK